MNTSFILDTNLFFNMDAALGVGSTSEEIIRTITQLIRERKKEGNTFYMPPRILEEFTGFFNNPQQPFLQEFIAELTVKAPDANNIHIGAGLFYKLVNEIRNRSYRGMDIGEEEIKKGAQMFIGKEHMDKVSFEKTIGPSIKGFRDRYRNATRVGFLDSLADLDLIMLAKETDGVVVTTDEGVLKWGRMFGVKEMPSHVFGQHLRGK